MADPLDKLYQEPPGSKETDVEEPDAPIVVKVDDEEEEDEEEKEPAAAKEEGEKRPPRRQRRQNRYKEAMDKAEAAERAAEEARLAVQRAEVRAETFRAQLEAERRRPAGDPANDYKKRRADIYARQARIQQEFDALPEEQQVARRETMQEEIYDLNDQLAKLRQEQNAPPDRGEMMQDVQAAIMRARHQDVLGNRIGTAYAKSHFLRLVDVHGKPKTMATFEEAVQLAREEMGGDRRSPTEKARFGGVPARGNGASGKKKVTEIRMGPREREMAREAYSHLPEQEAFKKWAQAMAKDLE
jgi:hypothetical protein